MTGPRRQGSLYLAPDPCPLPGSPDRTSGIGGQGFDRRNGAHREAVGVDDGPSRRSRAKGRVRESIISPRLPFGRPPCPSTCPATSRSPWRGSGRATPSPSKRRSVMPGNACTSGCSPPGFWRSMVGGPGGTAGVDHSFAERHASASFRDHGPGQVRPADRPVDRCRHR